MPTARTKKADSSSAPEGTIVVTAQQSRFHEIDDPASKDIDVNDLTISIGQRVIVQNTRLVLKTGLRYVFVGRNGLGKSTVLKALAERKMPGVPPNLRVLLLDQTLIEERRKEYDQPEQAAQSVSVLEHVASSDKRRQRLLRDSTLLSDALQDDSPEPTKISTVYRKLKLEEAQRSLQEAQLLAQHRSGARGSKARQVLLQQEEAVTAAENLTLSIDTDNTLGEVEAATSMLESLQSDLDAIGSASMEARAHTALIGLGFSSEQIEGSIGQLSGGWQTRAALAAALIQKTDVLLLDEPTNFLDLPAVIWLQHYLTTSLPASTTLVVTTHDREFADTVAESLLILRVTPEFTLETFTGSLSDYYDETRRQIRRMTKMSAALEKKKSHMESTMQNSIAAAKRTGDDKKLKLAASRKKKLEERTGLEVGTKGGRFKLNRDLPGYHLTNRADIDIPALDPPVTMSIPDQPSKLRNTDGALISLENVNFTYNKAKKATLININLNIHPGSRTALVGLNGSGKTTLVNLITSTFLNGPLAAGKTSGNISHHPQAQIAQYNQHATTTLLQKGLSEPTLTPLTYLSRLYPSIAEQPLRALLSGLALPPATQAHTPLSALSGGQLVRVALAECLLPSPPHLLILDEPTTHLDADSIIALIRALKHYQGALLIVSHDRFFIRCVVEGMSVRQASSTRRTDEEEESESSGDEVNDQAGSVGRVYRLTRTSGRMIHLPRGMDEYEEIVVKQLARQGINI